MGYLPKGGERDGRGLCPYDPNHNSTVTFVGEYQLPTPGWGGDLAVPSVTALAAGPVTAGTAGPVTVLAAAPVR